MRNILEFDELLEIVDRIKYNQVFEFNFFDTNIQCSIEYFDEVFENATELVNWVENNLKYIFEKKILLDIDHIMTKTYYDARLEELNIIFLVFEENSAILVRKEIENSIKIDCSSYESYKNQLTIIILNRK